VKTEVCSYRIFAVGHLGLVRVNSDRDSRGVKCNTWPLAPLYFLGPVCMSVLFSLYEKCQYYMNRKNKIMKYTVFCA
jgi:hypothetical protein